MQISPHVTSTEFMYTPFQWVKADVIARLARDCPNHELINYVVDGFCNGFHLGITWWPPPWGPCENLAKVLEDPEGVQELVDEEVVKGHILGPFDEEPFENMVYSPKNMVPKPNGKNRLIHDLSHLWNKHTLVNACIPDHNSKVKYHYIDELIKSALELRASITRSWIDVAHAFRNLGIHIDDLLV